MSITRNINDDNTLAYLFKKTIDIVYPVGSIYMSLNSTSPNKLFGGKWERIEGRFLLGATDGGATNTNANASQAAGSMAGEAAHTLTVAEMPSHTHDLHRQQWYGADAIYSTSTGAIYSWKSDAGTGGSTSQGFTDGANRAIQYTGGSGAHNNMPPFLAVYMWKRTA